ncbi:MAG: PaaI family thioesterase [Pseudomonadota bacterium]|nr:PaaI family thioesterase [Pseudomonadota bacterium]
MPPMTNFTAPNPDYQDTVKRILLAMPYVQWLGLTFKRIAPGEVEFLMPHRAEITFDHEALQAGPVGSLLDFAGATAAFTLVPAGVMLATIDYSVKLLATAVGTQFLGRGQVISRGKSLTVARADVFALSDAGERHVATGLVTTRTLH